MIRRRTPWSVPGAAAEAVNERVSASALKLIPAFRTARIEQWIEKGAAAPGTRELRRLLEQIIEAHLEKKLKTRAMLAEEI